MESVTWNWEEGTAYVRFEPGRQPEESAIRRAIEEETRYSIGEIRYLYALFELPDALQ